MAELDPLTRALPLPVAGLDRTGAIIAVNPAWSSMQRDPAAPFPGVGSNLIDLCRAAPDDEALAHVASSLRSLLSDCPKVGGSVRQLLSTRCPCHTPDVHVHHRLRIVCVPDHPEIQALVTHEEAPAAERLLKEGRSRWHRAEADLRLHADIFHHIQLGLVIWRLDDDGRAFRLVAANPAASRIAGHEMSDQIGLCMAEIFPSPRVEEVSDMMREVLRTSQMHEALDFPYTLGPTPRLLAMRMFVLPERCVGIALEDVTDRRTLEMRLRQTEKMDTVGRLAGGLAHDFNNVLTTILASASVLDETLVPGDPRRDAARDVIDAAERGAGMTRRLLMLSRRQKTEARPVNLNAIVGGLSNLLRRIVGPKVQLDAVLADALPDVVADPTELEQVILNLVVNAAQAMPEGGRLLVQTGNGELESAEAVTLTIADTGIGMDAATRAKIFEPFFTTKAEGTGLGLATVYGIVTRAGGDIEVESEPGRGTTFIVRVPAAA